MSDAIANALRIAAPNDMGGISRALIDALRQKAASGDPNAQAGMAQHDAAMTNPLWGSSTYLSQQPANNLGEALQKVPPEAMFLSNFLGPAPKRIPNPIKAYHGSPHDFEKFDLSKIGTGEGAQAYGSGLYFAENEKVAKLYRDNLKDAHNVVKDPTGAAIDNSVMYGADPASLALHRLREAGDFGVARQRLEQEAANTRSWRKDASKIEEAIAELDRLKAEGYSATANPGKMYEVAIHATPDQFLDWDKPLSQQSEAVRKAVDAAYGGNVGVIPDKTGQAALDIIARRRVNGDWGDPGEFAKKQATEALQQQGIPGIRYLDQGSRGTGQGTHNYVVFSPELIEILRKYGLFGPVAAGALANSLAGDGNQ